MSELESLLTRTLRVGLVGDDVYGNKRTVLRGLDKADGGRRLKALEAKPLSVRRTFGPFFRSDVKTIRRLMGHTINGTVDENLWDAMGRRGYPDAKAIDLMNAYISKHPPRPKVPDLGPVYRGGLSVLRHDLTHATDGIHLYPAFDDAFMTGTDIIAPEDLRVTQSSNSNPGLAFYATGRSNLRYWFGHLDRTHAAGRSFRKGEFVGNVAANHTGGGPHVHVGVNVELLWGPGQQLRHNTNYTHGAPTIGAQLAGAR